MSVANGLPAVLVLLLAGGLAAGQPAEPAEPAAVAEADAAPPWQRTWGFVGLAGYPSGRKMAPNGAVYQPLFDLDLLLNIGLTPDRSLYFFSRARFWAEKPDAERGITNANQGWADFSKRQYDLDAGLAWNYFDRLEARVFLYSDNNLNRGIDLVRPYGFTDGVALENRYYLPSTDFDRGLYRYLSLGSYVTKELVGADGRRFKPTLFLAGSLAADVVPERLYAYLDFQLISRRPVQPRLLLADVGVAFRPFVQAPDLEFRVGADSTYDIEVDRNRTLFYGHVRVVW